MMKNNFGSVFDSSGNMQPQVEGQSDDTFPLDEKKRSGPIMNIDSDYSKINLTEQVDLLSDTTRK